MQLIFDVENILLENLNDDSFGINKICKEIGISRSQLHNRIKKETGLSTSHFINSIRLKKAIQLLEKNELNITQIAYEVGFNDPSYFSRLFKDSYGCSPKNYKHEKNYFELLNGRYMQFGFCTN